MRIRLVLALVLIAFIVLGTCVLLFPHVVAEWRAETDGGSGLIELAGGPAYSVFVSSRIPYYFGMPHYVHITIARALDNATLWTGVASFSPRAEWGSGGDLANQWVGDVVLPADGAYVVWWRLEGDLPITRPTVRLTTPFLPPTLAFILCAIGFAGLIILAVIRPRRYAPGLPIVVGGESGRSEPFALKRGMPVRVRVEIHRVPEDGLHLDLAMVPTQGEEAVWSVTVLLRRTTKGRTLEETITPGAEGSYIVTWRADAPLPLSAATVRIEAGRRRRSSGR